MDKDAVCEVIFKLILFCGFIAIIVGMFVGAGRVLKGLDMAYGEYEDNLWNNGYCPECNVKYEYIDSITEGLFHEDTDYIYECPKCHKHIRLETLDNEWFCIRRKQINE